MGEVTQATFAMLSLSFAVFHLYSIFGVFCYVAVFLNSFYVSPGAQYFNALVLEMGSIRLKIASNLMLGIFLSLSHFARWC